MTLTPTANSTRTSRISTVSSQMPQPRKMGVMSALTFSFSASRFVITSTMLIWLTASRIVEMARVCTFSLWPARLAATSWARGQRLLSR